MLNHIRHPFGRHQARLIEQGINLDDLYLQQQYESARVRYSDDQLEQIIAVFEWKNSNGYWHTPQAGLCSSLQNGWGLR